MLLLNSLTLWLEKHQLPCLYKKFLGIECPGCGLQSSVIELLKGNIRSSIELYPALIPMIALCLCGAFYAVFKFRYGDIITIIIAIFTGVIMTLSYIARLTMIY